MTVPSTSSSRACAPQRLSPTRTRATWKPRVDEADVPVYRCARCGRVLVAVGAAAASVDTDLWRSTIVRSPYAEPACASCVSCASCSPDLLQPVAFRAACAADEGFSYAFTGGMDANRLTLSWAPETPAPTLAVLKTFTGLQVADAPRGRAVTFFLADEDAYCYCDLDPCEWCVARCKRGFKLYVLRADGAGLRFLCELPPDAKPREE